MNGAPDFSDAYTTQSFQPDPNTVATGSWDNFLHVIAGDVTDIIRATRGQPSSNGQPGWADTSIGLPAQAPPSTTGLLPLLLLAALIFVVMEA